MHNMKLLIVTECFHPDIYAVNDIVKTLVSRGHKVTVLTGLPDYTTSYIPEEYKHGKNRHQDYFGTEVFRVPTIARRHGAVFRALSYLSFAINGWFAAKCRKWEEFDVIYVWEVSPVTMAVPAIALKKRYKKPLFLYCMDIWPECVKAMGFREGTFSYRLIHKWSSRIYRQCDHIAVSSKPFFSYLEEVNGVDRAKMSYLPQYASEELLEEDFTKSMPGEAAANKTGDAEGSSHHTDFLYIGNIGKAQNLDCLVRAAAILKDREDVTFHMIGGGSEYESIVNLARETGADRIIRFYGPKPAKEAKEYYRRADACVLTLDGNNRIGDTLPGKLQTYMAAGKPIFGALNGAGREIIEESGCGAAVHAGDIDGFAGILRNFTEHPEQYADCEEKARLFFREHFRKERHFETLESRLKAMTEEGTR